MAKNKELPPILIFLLGSIVLGTLGDILLESIEVPLVDPKSVIINLSLEYSSSKCTRDIVLLSIKKSAFFSSLPILYFLVYHLIYVSTYLEIDSIPFLYLMFYLICLENKTLIYIETFIY